MALRTDEPVHQSQKEQDVHERNYDERSWNHLNNDFGKLIG